MKGYGFQWRMALRRKDSCLLVLLFTAVVTVFMLLYPQLIRETKQHLEEAYSETIVKGWIYNAADYVAPNIPEDDWQKLLDSGFFSEHATYMEMHCELLRKDILDGKSGSSDESRLRAMQLHLAEIPTIFKGNSKIRGYSSFSACDDLMRVRDKITWEEGYSEASWESDERICIISDRWGYELGETIPVMVEKVLGPSDASQIIVRLKVVGLHPGTSVGTDCIIPIGTMNQMCEDAMDTFAELKAFKQWDFAPNSFIFTFEDNRRIEESKELFDEMGYDGSGEHGLRIAIDDRILQGTVAPIESNLALLEGLYLFFFVMVTAIGFFLCFLLVRGRKAEYAIMRMLGESTMQITLKVLLEQSLLCLLGILFASLFVRMTGLGTVDLLICTITMLCYSFGAAVAVLMTVRVNVMEILRDKE